MLLWNAICFIDDVTQCLVYLKHSNVRAATAGQFYGPPQLTAAPKTAPPSPAPTTAEPTPAPTKATKAPVKPVS
jgi:hypothetical protein